MTWMFGFCFQSQNIWKGILSNVPAIEDTTDFFKSGAASMDVVRWEVIHPEYILIQRLKCQ